jgi:D-alanine-D-alanine ligase
MKIAVLKGGPSAEAEVSLRTGAAVAEALRTLHHEVTEVEVHGLDFKVSPGTEAVFICLHGAFGEDGQVQSLLEQRGLPYTGCGIESSRLAFDKELAKERFYQAKVSTPAGQVWRAGQQITVPPPLIIKPACQGSSVGLQFVESSEVLAEALAAAEKFGDALIIEHWLRGPELTVGILGEEALPVVGIKPKQGHYDYTNKYTAGNTIYECPAVLSPEVTQRVQAEALAAHRVLGCRVYSRVDIMLDEAQVPYVLEVNTIPGMTATSLLPKAAAAAGLSFPELCAKILNLSLKENRS